ncbi:hypothetical protein JOB18_025506 [Solea senegalensis]|uniref:Secreted protein n=1 Tax=Solea senegalensis TaxID=28829 RepID=A0AAV6RQR8_SOLSE|nr:hypothetical protein JOB18_025506 [Solea senegalensis]
MSNFFLSVFRLLVLIYRVGVASVERGVESRGPSSVLLTSGNTGSTVVCKTRLLPAPSGTGQTEQRLITRSD